MEMMQIVDYIAQAGLFISGGASVYLVARKDKWMRWGYVVAWFGQPFFLFTAWYHGQIGVFLLAIWYWIQWSKGIYNYFYKEEK